MVIAQRRPGPRPRRHLMERHLSMAFTLRSTKAGAETPATHHIPWVHCLMLQRSTKAGAETPATHGTGNYWAPIRRSLNEGRGRDPGDTRVFH